MANLTRRAALRSLTTTALVATIAVPPAAAGMAAPHDPLLEAINEYRAGLAIYNASDHVEDETPEAEALIATTWGKLYFADTPPVPTTSAGAAAALQCAIDEEAFIDDFAERLLRAVLTYLDAQTARGL
jgi:hypothetical protein